MELKNVEKGLILVIVTLILLVAVLLQSPHYADFNTSGTFQTSVNLHPSPNVPDVPENLFLNSAPTVFSKLTKKDEGKNNPSEDKIAKLVRLFDSYFKKTFQLTGIPGSAVVIVYKDQIIYMKTLGVKKIGENDPINLDTLFQIGSCTKAFTATLIGALVDEGKMSWEDTARQYYPEHAYFDLYNSSVADEITMRDLLSHRSGLPEHAGSFHVLDFWYDFDETLPFLRFLPPESVFRTKYAYQNILLSLAGHSAGVDEGTTWDELMKEKLFQPLQMDTSTTNLQDYLNSPNHASGHRIINDQTQYVDPINLDAMGPAGTISASIKELGNWLRFQLHLGQFNGQQIVSSQSIAETRKPQILINEYPGLNETYGLGWLVYTGDLNMVAHTGSTRTFNSNTYLFPADDLGIIIVSNEGTSGNDYGYVLAKALYSLYKKGVLPANEPLSDYYNPPHEDDIQSVLKNNELPFILNAEPLPYPIDNYAGNYISDYWGNIKIEKNNETSLLLYPGKNPNPITLNHYNSSSFNESDYNSAVNFTNFIGGQPQQVYVERWGVCGANGTFNRV